MTTVAYRDGILAADSQATDSQLWTCDKLFQIETDAGRLMVGIAGDVHAALVFVEWLKNQNSRKPSLSEEDFAAIVVAKNGRVTIWNPSLVPWKPRGKFFAIGSGAPCAMTAMHCGKTAVQAVNMACKVDPYTRGPVRSLRLK